MSLACGIDLGEYFVVTGGGYPDMDTVTLYSEAGFVKDLARLKQGRYKHACSKFVDEIGNNVCFI